MNIQLNDSRKAYEPGDEFSGQVSWRLDKPPKAVELRLFWFTRGIGTPDAGVVEVINFDQPRSDDSRPFRFRLPETPPSFSGKLISLIWAVELVAEPSKQNARVEITVAPGGEEVYLHSLPERPRRKRWLQFPWSMTR